MMITISKLLESISCFMVATSEAQARWRLVEQSFFSHYE